MCGRVIQSSEPLRLAIVDGLDVSRVKNISPRYNAAPSQELPIIRQNRKTGERSLDLIKWGLIPNWCQDPKGWAQAHQCQGGDYLEAADVPGGLCFPALHCARRRLL
jgi:putative SOS response-associated peptidase YedK